LDHPQLALISDKMLLELYSSYPIQAHFPILVHGKFHNLLNRVIS
jgi:hypothetical protein